MKKFSLLLFVLSIAANKSDADQATDYTKCEVINPAPTGLCLPASGVAVSTPISLTRNSDSAFTVAVVPRRNCRTESTDFAGSTVLVMDGSSSLVATDPKNERLQASEEFLDFLKSKADSTLIPQGNANHPKVGVVNYGGRVARPLQPGDAGYTIDSDWCASADTGANIYPNDREKWLEKVGTTLISRCEYLGLIEPNSPGNVSFDNYKDFINYTGTKPRGSTELEYFLQSANKSNMLAGTTANSRNVVMITDGLPNVPKRMSESDCKSKSWLRTSPIQTDPVTGEKYCESTNFRAVGKNADNYVTNTDAFRNYNVYNILYTGSNITFTDKDDEGTMFPTDYLAQNSARSGNGRVKFAVARNGDELTSYLQGALATRYTGDIVHHVEITKTNAPHNGLVYNAVSTPERDKIFTLKFLGMTTDALHTYSVKTFYNDGGIGTEDFSITVAQNGPITNPYECSNAPKSKTIDGDDFGSERPLHPDGTHPSLANDGKIQREYWKYDPENPDDGRQNLRFVSEATLTGVKVFDEGFRVQGGTGNCGTIGGRVATSGFLLALPLALLGLMQILLRRRKK